MAALRPPRPVAPGAFGTPPRCLRIRGAAAVWGLQPGDPAAPRRWRAAADAWRSRALAAGMSQAEVWSALPAGAHRFRADDEIIVRGTLARLGLDEADLPTLAAEARATWPPLFDRSWSPEAATEAPRERAQRLAGLAP